MATENKNLSQYNKNELPSVRGKRFAIVTSEWNSEVTFNMEKGAIDTLLNCGAAEQDIQVVRVPGSVELVNGAKRVLTTNKNIDAVITIGCVIQGETKHFDFVCHAVTQGVAYLNATQEKPVIFCVLTDNNMQQSLERSGGKHGNKGIEAAVAAIKMVYLPV